MFTPIKVQNSEPTAPKDKLMSDRSPKPKELVNSSKPMNEQGYEKMTLTPSSLNNRSQLVKVVSQQLMVSSNSVITPKH